MFESLLDGKAAAEETAKGAIEDLQVATKKAEADAAAAAAKQLEVKLEAEKRRLHAESEAAMNEAFAEREALLKIEALETKKQAAGVRSSLLAEHNEELRLIREEHAIQAEEISVDVEVLRDEIEMLEALLDEAAVWVPPGAMVEKAAPAAYDLKAVASHVRTKTMQKSFEGRAPSKLAMPSQLKNELAALAATTKESGEKASRAMPSQLKAELAALAAATRESGGNASRALEGGASTHLFDSPENPTNNAPQRTPPPASSVGASEVAVAMETDAPEARVHSMASRLRAETAAAKLKENGEGKLGAAPVVNGGLNTEDRWRGYRDDEEDAVDTGKLEAEEVEENGLW